MKSIIINPDSLHVSGPNKDGGYIIKFTLGEYEATQAALLMMLNRSQNLKVIVEERE